MRSIPGGRVTMTGEFSGGSPESLFGTQVEYRILASQLRRFECRNADLSRRNRVRSLRLSAAVSYLLLVQCCTPTAPAASPSRQSLPIRVSMIQLLAAPERFEGRRVQVQGFYRIESEDHAL